MNFIHAADLHLDSVYGSFGKPDLEAEAEYQRKVLWDLIHLTRSQKADALLIAGDLVHARYVKEETWACLRSAFEFLGDTPVIMAPGNHDPRPVYDGAGLPANVHVFGPAWSSVLVGGTEIWGIGWDGPGTAEPSLASFPGEPLVHPNRRVIMAHGTAPVILMRHGAFAPFSVGDLLGLGCCYVAMGHHHRVKVGVSSSTGLVACYPGAVRGPKSVGDAHRTAIAVELEDGEVRLRHFMNGGAGFVRTAPPKGVCIEVE